MASSKKNYFRHSFNARNDDFINGLIEKFGLSGYYYYFSLIELCGELSSGIPQEKYKLHRRTLVTNLRLTTRKLGLVLGYLESESKITYTLVDNSYEIMFPKLSEFMGSYSQKEIKNFPKRKESKVKESKVKESKVKESKKNGFDFNKIYSEYPRKEGKTKGFEKCNKIIKTENHFNNLMLSVKNYSKKCKEEKTEKKYIKQFSSFMSCWEDYLDYTPIKKNPNILSFDDLVKMSTTMEQ